MRFALLLVTGSAFAGSFEAGLAAYRSGNCARSVELLRQAAAETPRDAQVRNNLGAALYSCARYEEAETAYREALDLWTDPADKASTHHNLSVLHRSRANLEAAQQEAERAVALSDAAVYSHGLGEVLRLRGDFEGARAALDVAERMRTTPEVLSAILQSRGVLAVDQGRLAEAQPLLHQSAALLERTGASTAALLGPKAALANVLLGLGRLDEAEPILRWLVPAAESSYGASHPRVAVHLNNLAQLRRRQRRLQEAEPLYLRAIEIWNKTAGAAHPDYARGLHNLASLFVEQGKIQGAEKLYLEALTIAEKTLGRSHAQTRLHAAGLAELYRAAHRTVELDRIHKAFR